MNKLAAACLVLCWPVLVSAQAVLYSTSGNGNYSSLYVVNPATAQATLVGPVLAGSTQMIITGLAVHPLTGVMYGVTGREAGPERQLVTIDPTTAQAVIIGGLGVGSSDITFASDGTLYSWATGGGQLGTINLSTGLVTPIGTAFTNLTSGGLSFTPAGTLYLANNSSLSSTGLWIDNPATGALTLGATLSNIPANFGRINSLASDADGLLYATGNSSANVLVTINPATGVVSSVGVLSFGEADALVFFTPVPEPSTWALLVFGLGLVGLVIRRRF